MQPLSESELARQMAIEAVTRELASFQKVDDDIEQRLARSRERRRRAGGASVVFTVRLDPDEVDALERRAATWDLKPSVLARNLIRSGLHAAGTRGASDARKALDDVERSLADLRELLTRARMA